MKVSFSSHSLNLAFKSNVLFFLLIGKTVAFVLAAKHFILFSSIHKPAAGRLK